jgi:hypothetical protein
VNKKTVVPLVWRTVDGVDDGPRVAEERNEAVVGGEGGGVGQLEPILRNRLGRKLQFVQINVCNYDLIRLLKTLKSKIIVHNTEKI